MSDVTTLPGAATERLRVEVKISLEKGYGVLPNGAMTVVTAVDILREIDALRARIANTPEAHHG